MSNLCLQPFDISKELLIQRFKQGIRLVRPNSYAENTSQKSIESLFSLGTQMYFKDYETKIVSLNQACVEIANVESPHDVINRRWSDFATPRFGETVLKSDLAVINSAKMHILEETGKRLDGFIVQTVSFKFPWYHNQKIIGLFGCSIKIDSNHVKDFANIMSQFMSTGLLGQAPSSRMAFLPELKDGDIYFSKREREVLALLVRGKTAKEVGAILHISKRTAEIHIKNAKAKANCASKSELIDKFVDRFI